MSEIFPGMHYLGNQHYPMYEVCERDGDLDGTRWYEEHELTLPIHPMLTDEDLKNVVEVVNG
jgi:dTDP-4-amino-4,6-dideoxygalactose transaminase